MTWPTSCDKILSILLQSFTGPIGNYQLHHKYRNFYSDFILKIYRMKYMYQFNMLL